MSIPDSPHSSLYLLTPSKVLLPVVARLASRFVAEDIDGVFARSHGVAVGAVEDGLDISVENRAPHGTMAVPGTADHQSASRSLMRK